MATLTLSVAASGDNYAITDADNPSGPSLITVGGVGTTPLAGHGAGFRFTGASLLDGATINSAYLSLMKSGSTWPFLDHRWTFENSDSPASLSGSSPNRPGDRAIVTSGIVDEQPSFSLTNGTRYSFPQSSGNKTALGANLQTVTDRAGFTSTIALIYLVGLVVLLFAPETKGQRLPD